MILEFAALIAGLAIIYYVPPLIIGVVLISLEQTCPGYQIPSFLLKPGMET